MFFRGDEICVVDWQWTGAGLAATDIFCLCAMALSDDAVEHWEDEVC